MKKALLVVGLALSASLAFAQSESVRLGQPQDVKMDFEGAAAAAATNYKASIFTKARIDTIQTFRFDEASMANITCGIDGEVTGTSTVYSYVASNNTWKLDTLVRHGQTQAFLHWERVADSVSFIIDDRYTSFGSQAYLKSYITRYMGRPYVSDNHDNISGFMLMTMLAAHGSGDMDAYFQLPAVPKCDTAVLLDIKFTQMYRKYYDQCYIDYKIGDAWYTRAINVENIDVEVNSFAPIYASYTMPAALAQESSYIIRFRYRSADRGNSYGYAWAVDNVAITVGAGPGEADRWFANNERYVDGAYGQIPQGFHIPLSWYGTVINNGANHQGGVVATTYTFDANKENPTQLLQVSVDSIYANPTIEQYAVINERGFMPTRDSIGYAGWFGRGTGASTNYNSNTIQGDYGKRALPTSTLGRNYVTTTVTNPTSSVSPAAFDTIAYNVTTATGGDGSTLAVNGYRWSHDNGIIPAGSRYSTGYTDADASGNYFVTDSGHYGDTRYQVRVRYTTPDEIPTDVNGDPWVFLGMEIVPQTMEGVDVPAADMVGSRIYPIMTRIDYKINTTPDSSGYYTQSSVNTGASDVVPHVVTLEEVNEGMTVDYLSNEAAYNAVNIRFFNMPEIEPNTSYYFGYMIAEPSKFAAARSLYSYRTSSGAYSSYLRAADLAPWYNQFRPGTYDTWVYDPANPSANLFAGYHDGVFPMIRAIVGPRATLTTHNVYGNCADENISLRYINDAGTQWVNLCGTPKVAYEGSDPTVYVFGSGDATIGTQPGIVDEIIIGDAHVSVTDINDPTKVPEGVTITERNDFLYDEDSVLLLERYAYVVTISNIQSNVIVSAAGHKSPWKLGIEAEATNVSLGLQPNPATSQVSLNVKGVTGMVNCSIIDMSGRVVYSRNLNAEEQHIIKLDNIAAGAYFVRVTNDSFSKVQKLIVR